MKRSIAIFGGGPASLALASFLDPYLYQITIYEQNKTCGRKFLVAGKGGFNLTHSEELASFTKKYTPTDFLEKALHHFTNEDLQNWLSNLGIETFVGSSGRVFPIRGIKPIEVLDGILRHLSGKGVTVRPQSQFTGWSESGRPIINGSEEIDADSYIYAFGGASWKVTGSNGHWAELFSKKGIEVLSFLSSNCGFKVDWPEILLSRLEGKPLKNIIVTCNGKSQKGEVVITEFGLEGNGIYGLSNTIRNQLKNEDVASISIDFKPMFDEEKVNSIIKNSKSKNNTEILRNELKLSKTHIGLIKGLSDKESFTDLMQLGKLIKSFGIDIVGMSPIDEAISTVGGIHRDELTDRFELKKLPSHFCIGEMVDWDAPTGGYLLQGCFSMGAWVAEHLNKKEEFQ